MIFSLDINLEKNSLAENLNSLLGKILKFKNRSKGMLSSDVELLYQVSMLPFFSFNNSQHVNNQQILSPAVYPFYAGDKK